MTNFYWNGMRTNLTLQQPTGTWTNRFQYDAAWRLTNVTSWAGSFGYTLAAMAAGSPLAKKVSLPNASYVTNTYDNVARLTGTYLKNSSHTILDSATYGYNSGNQRTSFTNAAGTYYLFAYDNVGQLTIGDSSVSTEDRGYYYDAAWNLARRTNNGSSSTLLYDTKNELTNAFSGTYTYDGNGNLTNLNSSGPQSFSYDDENRLTSVSQSTTWRTDFVYDGLGRKRSQTEYTWNGSSWIPGTTTYYFYDGMRVIQERTTSPTVSYTRGTDLSGSLEGADGIGGLLARSSGYSSGNWTTNHSYHADGNGNITYLVDSSQALAASYRYDPFGNTISSSGGLASANVYRFSSKERHANSGMYYYGFRFYDPNLQRWVNRDPSQERGGINLYEFVYNNPLLYFDDVGHEPALPPGWGGFRRPYNANSNPFAGPAPTKADWELLRDALRQYLAQDDGTVPHGTPFPDGTPFYGGTPPCPKIFPSNLIGMTRSQIRALAQRLGLLRKGKPDNLGFPRKWIDPVTKRERLRLDS